MSSISEFTLGFGAPFLLFFPFTGVLTRAGIVLCVGLLSPSGGVFNGLLLYVLSLTLFMVPVFISRIVTKSISHDLKIPCLDIAFFSYFFLLFTSRDSFALLGGSQSASEMLSSLVSLSFLVLVPFVSAVLVFDLCSLVLHRLQIKVLPTRLLRVFAGIGFIVFFAVPKLSDIVVGI